VLRWPDGRERAVTLSRGVTTETALKRVLREWASTVGVEGSIDVQQGAGAEWTAVHTAHIRNSEVVPEPSAKKSHKRAYRKVIP
jgi:hypothetical protein